MAFNALLPVGWTLYYEYCDPPGLKGGILVETGMGEESLAAGHLRKRERTGGRGTGLPSGVGRRKGQGVRHSRPPLVCPFLGSARSWRPLRPRTVLSPPALSENRSLQEASPVLASCHFGAWLRAPGHRRGDEPDRACPARTPRPGTCPLRAPVPRGRDLGPASLSYPPIVTKVAIGGPGARHQSWALVERQA